MDKKKIVILIIYILTMQQLLYAENKVISVSINDCVRQGLKNNLTVKISEIDIKMADQKLKSQYSSFEPVFTSSAVTKESESKSSISSSVSKSKYFTASAGVTKLFVTGADISLEHSLTRKSSSYTNQLGLTLTQPLLKDRGTDINSTWIRIENNNKDITDLNFKSDCIDVITAIEKYYWELGYYRQLYNVRQQSLSLARDILKQNKDKVRAGKMAPVEIIRAEANAALYEQRIIEAKNNILNTQDELIKLLNVQGSQVMDEVTVVTTDSPVIITDVPELKESISYAMNNSPVYLTAKKEIESSDLRAAYYKNQVYPSLDLQGSLDLNGIDEEYGRSYDDIAGADQPSWELKLAFSMPIGNTKNKTAYMNEKYQYSQKLYRLKQVENDIVTDIKTKIRNIKSSIESYNAAEKSVRLAEENLRAEIKRFELNKSTTHDVMEYQEDLAEAQNSLLKSVIDNQNAVIAYESATGKTLDKFKIYLAAE